MNLPAAAVVGARCQLVPRTKLRHSPISCGASEIILILAGTARLNIRKVNNIHHEGNQLTTKDTKVAKLKKPKLDSRLRGNDINGANHRTLPGNAGISFLIRR
jgi:cell division septal protein FtsQ